MRRLPQSLVWIGLALTFAAVGVAKLVDRGIVPPSPPTDVVLTDAGLAAAISDASAGRNLRELKRLIARDQGVRNLNGIQGCTSLSELDLSFNVIADISPLSNLPLRKLTLQRNHLGVQELSPIANMATLEVLNISGNPVAEFPFLSGLPKLYCLDLSYTLLATLDPLRTFVSSQSDANARSHETVLLDVSRTPVATFRFDPHSPQTDPERWAALIENERWLEANGANIVWSDKVSYACN